jgi:Ankyrin repeats (3 copies)/Ankyrin repeat
MGLTRAGRDDMVRELDGLATNWNDELVRIFRAYKLPDVGVPFYRGCGGSEDPLMIAVRTDDLATVERLLAAGANVNEDFAARDHDDKGGWWPDGSTPLMAAVCPPPSGTVDDKMVDLLIARGAQVDRKASLILWTVQWNKWVQLPRRGWTPLLCAAAYGRYYPVKDLVDHHADVNVHTERGLTPLHYAAALDKKGIVQVLLAARADVDAADSDGDTALHLAARGGHVDIVPLLVAAHANVNLRNTKGQTPLDVAASEDMRVALRKAGAKRAGDVP